MAGPNAWWNDAQEWLRSAQTQKKAGQVKPAYFSAGFAVETALKAIYMKRKGLADWPPDLKGAPWHDLRRVAEAAGLAGDLAQLQRTSKARYTSWLTVRDWKSEARFPGNAPRQKDLNDLFLAVCHERDGIMEWLRGIYQSI